MKNIPPLDRLTPSATTLFDALLGRSRDEASVDSEFAQFVPLERRDPCLGLHVNNYLGNVEIIQRKQSARRRPARRYPRTAMMPFWNRA